jgi:hypothetical protein
LCCLARRLHKKSDQRVIEMMLLPPMIERKGDCDAPPGWAAAPQTGAAAS